MKADRENKNVKKCPDCGDTMGINRNGQHVCICEARRRADENRVVKKVKD